MKHFIIASILIAFYYNVNAQSIPQYNLYNQNLFLINPAAIGLNGGVNVYAGHKTQWTGYNDAPQNTYFTANSLLTKSMGVGININRQQYGIFSVMNLGVDYAYRIGFSRYHALSLGVSINFAKNDISTENLYPEELVDPALVSNNFDQSLFYTGFGIEYRYKDFGADLSVPVLYGVQEHQFFQSNFLFLNYTFRFSNNIWKLKPSVLLRYDRGSPVQADINALVDWNSLVWFQTSYRTNKQVLFAAGVFIKHLGIAYAYELDTKPLVYASGGSHEITVLFDFPIFVNKKHPLYYDGRRRSSWN